MQNSKLSLFFLHVPYPTLGLKKCAKSVTYVVDKITSSRAIRCRTAGNVNGEVMKEMYVERMTLLRLEDILMLV